MDGNITFGYWGVRGRGQTGRLLLHYTAANWVDKKYASPNEWFEKDKTSLGFSFANLPYLIDGQLKLTESMAINRYIINRSDKKQLLGKGLRDQGKVDNLVGIYEDVQKGLFKILFSEDFETAKTGALQGIKGKMSLLQKFYGDNDFAVGYLTFVDFLLAEFGYYVQKVDPNFYSQFPFLAKLRSAFLSLPEIKSYYQKQDAVKLPFMPPNAKINPSLDG